MRYRPEPGRVWTGDVDDEYVGIGGECVHACDKVVWRIDRGGFVLAEIDGEDFVWVQRRW